MATPVELIDAVARVAVSALFNSLWQGLAVTALVWVLLRVVRRINAGTRYLIWSVTLLGVLAMFVVVGRVPPDRSAVALLWHRSEAPAGRFDPVSREEEGFWGLQVLEVLQQRWGALGTERGVDAAGLPGQWPLLIFGLWCAVGLGMIGRVVWSFYYMLRLKRTCTPLPASYQRGFKRRLRTYGIHRWVRLCSSREICAPMAVGLVDPMVLIPEGLIGRLTEAEFDQVVLHELAHIHRRDHWTNLGQKLIESLFFFHPAVLWIGRQLNLEREVACDEQVVLATGEPRGYAVCLTRLVELVTGRGGPVLAFGALSGRKQMVRRIERLLEGKGRMRFHLSRAGVLAVLCLVVTAVVLCSRAGPVVEVPGRSEAFVKLANVRAWLVSLLLGDSLPGYMGHNRGVVVLADASDWQALRGGLGEMFERKIRTPQRERLFWWRFAEPEAFKAFRQKNLVIAAPLDGAHATGDLVRSLISPEAQEAIRNGAPSVFIKREVWARDQVVVVVTGKDREALKENLAMEADRIYGAVEAGLNAWLSDLLYRDMEREGVTADLAPRFGWQVRVPFGFRLMAEHADSGFVMLARQTAGVTQWLFVYREDGISPDVLTDDWCIEKRDEITRRFFEGDVISLQEVEAHQREFAGKLAVYLEGLWVNHYAWKGGPFRSYAFVDIEQDRFYFVDVGIFAPNRKKALYLQKLELMARTFAIDPFYERQFSAVE